MGCGVLSRRDLGVPRDGCPCVPLPPASSPQEAAVWALASGPLVLGAEGARGRNPGVPRQGPWSGLWEGLCVEYLPRVPRP